MPATIGFIGLGIMGRPMAHNLLKAGFPLVIHHRHQEVTDEFIAAGARVEIQLLWPGVPWLLDMGRNGHKLA